MNLFIAFEKVKRSVN